MVGKVRTTLTGPLMYANQDYLGAKTGRFGESFGLQVVGERNDPASQTLLADALKERFEELGLKVSGVETTAETREEIVSQFNIIGVLLAVMAVLIAVGGLGLMGTMSISVLERTKEVGIMRAVGASDRSVLRVVLVEGLFIGLLSWLLASLVAYPLGWWISNLLGKICRKTDLLIRMVGRWSVDYWRFAPAVRYVPAVEPHALACVRRWRMSKMLWRGRGCEVRSSHLPPPPATPQLVI